MITDEELLNYYNGAEIELKKSKMSRLNFGVYYTPKF